MTKLNGLKTNVDNVTQDVLDLKTSEQQKETEFDLLLFDLIEDQTRVHYQIADMSRHGKWCGYQDIWNTANSIITYDSLKQHSSSYMDIIGTPLNINTGNYSHITSVIVIWTLIFVTFQGSSLYPCPEPGG